MSDENISASTVISQLKTAWGLDIESVSCPLCKNSFLIMISMQGLPCPNCARARLSPLESAANTEPPELVVPSRLSRPDVSSALAYFIKDMWFRPDDLNAEALLGRTVPVFLPIWLVDSTVNGSWEAEAGFDYQVKSSKESYDGGSWQSKENIETRIRWEPRLGQVNRRYTNIPAAALRRHQPLQDLVGNYHLDQAVPFQPASIAPAAFFLPDIPPQSAWPEAQNAIVSAGAQDCQKASAAQHIRNMNITSSFESQNWTKLLLPLYCTYYTDEAGLSHPIYINAQSGKVGGVRMASQKKGWQRAGSIAAIGGIILLVGLVFALIGLLFPPVSILGVILIFIAVCFGLAAIVPAAWPWYWNRQQQEK